MSNCFTGGGPRYGLLQLAVASIFAALAGTAGAEDIHPYNLAGLPPLGDEWKPSNPYRGDVDIARAGGIAFNQNCARCHGVDAVASGTSGMPAPDLRKLDRYCRRLKDSALKDVCMADNDDYFRISVLQGKTIVGVNHMPAWKDLLTQETIWAMKTFIESRSEAKP